MNKDERQGRDANMIGKPIGWAYNVDWLRGWQNAEDDRHLDERDYRYPRSTSKGE